MTSKEEKDQTLHFAPLGNPESPFLAEELFSQENETEWEMNLDRLEAESPFQTDVDLSNVKAGDAEVTEEEVEDSEEEEGPDRDRYAEEEAEDEFENDGGWQEALLDHDESMEGFTEEGESATDVDEEADEFYEEEEGAFAEEIEEFYDAEETELDEETGEIEEYHGEEDHAFEAVEEANEKDEGREEEAFYEENEGEFSAVKPFGEAEGWMVEGEEAEAETENHGYEEAFAEEEAFDESEFFASAGDAEAEWENPVELEQPPAVSSGITAFTSALGQEWAKKRGKEKPSGREIADWLLRDYQDTLEGARRRYKSKYGKGKFTAEAIGRAWMTSRREQMGFQTASPARVKSLSNFTPPSDKVALVSSKLVEGSDKAPVAPIVVRFVEELQRRHQGVGATTYSGHGGGSFNDRGYSLDLWLKGMDDRGFYPRDDAIKLLRAVDGAAGAINAEWRVIYNDFSVADAINRETGKNHVIFVGRVRKDKKKGVTGLNWHGPDPLILHFHLDLAPRKGASDGGQGGTGSSGKAAPSRPGAGTGKAPAELVRFAQQVLNTAEGERLKVDGDLGRLTRGGLERFRKRYSLGEGGILDSPTQIALAQRALEEIAQQSRFSQIGLLDDNTRQALSAFKSKNGLGFDATLDAATRAALAKALVQRTATTGASIPRQSQPSPGTVSGSPSTSGTPASTSPSGVSFKGGGWGGWKGRQTVATALIRQSGITINDKYEIAAAVSAQVETGGAFDKVQMYDKGILSWGIKQWTLHRGSLQGVLRFIQSKLAASGQQSLWTKLFPGIDMQGKTIVVNGTSYAEPQRDNDTADLALRKAFRGKESAKDFDKGTMDHWLTVFARAGRHPTIQKFQIEYAVMSLKTNLNKHLGKTLRARRDIKEAEINNYKRVGDYIESSELAVVLFNGMETQNPKWTYLYLKRIADRFAKRYGKTYDTSRWPAGWKDKFAEELKNEFEKSGVACWGTQALKKPACKNRTSRTQKILRAYKELSG